MFSTNKQQCEVLWDSLTPPTLKLEPYMHTVEKKVKN